MCHMIQFFFFNVYDRINGVIVTDDTKQNKQKHFMKVHLINYP